MRSEDYPSLYRSSDTASAYFQRIYISLFWSDLALMIAAALTGFFQSVATHNTNRRILGSLAIACILVSIGLKLVIRARKDDGIWFDCRAIAESVKTGTWRYMVGAPPLDITMSDAEADKRLIEQIGEIRKAKVSVASKISLHDSGGALITKKMIEIRHLPLTGRKEFYLENRLKPEQHWYSGKGKENSQASERVFWTSLFLLCTAGVCGIYQIIVPTTPSIIAVIVSAASARMVWGEMKRYKDLSQSYAVAASELEAEAALWPHIQGDQEFEAHVVQCEEAISREHTMWIAKRVI